MKIDSVSIVIENSTEDNATVRLVTSPVPREDEDIEDTPAVLLGSQIWELVETFLDQQDVVTHSSGTLQ